MGRLPWPVEGIVVAPFGTRIEPEFGTRTDAPGVDIASAAGAPVTAVFAGVVSRVGTIAAYGRYVMVRHGTYTTIYGNLSDVTVEEGQHVRTGASVGLAGTELERRGAGVFFAVFQHDDAVNPLPWLRPAP
jgi:septal ring factor EnvC (AmiA/AmiB activator)